MKYLLNEKYILTEDDTIATPQASFTKLQKVLDPESESIVSILQTVVDNTKKTITLRNNTRDKLATEYKKIAKLLAKKEPPVLDTLKHNITNFIQAFNNYIKFDGKNHLSSKFSDLIETIGEINGLMSSTKKDQSKLVQTCTEFVNAVGRTFLNTPTDQLVTGLTRKIDRYTELIEAISAAKIELDKKGSLLDELAEECYKNLEAISKKTTSSFNRSANFLLAKFNTSQLVQVITLLNNFVATARTKTATSKAASTSSTQSKASVTKIKYNPQTYSKWDKEFDELNNDEVKRNDVDAIETFWNKYYTTVWSKDLSKIRLLDKTFRIEAAYFGFSENNNPFIKFLKNHIADYNLNLQKYGILHNAYVYKTVSKDQLIDSTSKTNVLNYKELFDRTLDDIQELLEINRDLLKAQADHKLVTIGSTKDGDSNKVPVQKPIDDAFIIKLLSKDGVLRPTGEIHRFYIRAFGENEEVKKSVDSDSFNALVSDLGQKVSTADEKLQLASYILGTYLGSQQYLKTHQKLITDFPELKGVKVSMDMLAQKGIITLLDAWSIKSNTATAIIRALLEKTASTTMNP